MLHASLLLLRFVCLVSILRRDLVNQHSLLICCTGDS
jgi:hypothetical protein